jgi:methylmalonyl-CoA mutase N-terminal domain/subunit
VVGVNEFAEGSEEVEIDTLKIDPSVEERQRQRLADLRAARSDADVARALDELEMSCTEGNNVIPGILDCARAGCTLYEIRHAMEKTFGNYKEPVFF